MIWTTKLQKWLFFPVKCNFSSPSSLFSAIGEEQLILLEMESDFSEVALASELIKKDFLLRTLMHLFEALVDKKWVKHHMLYAGWDGWMLYLMW